jgi:hypothetical protein
MQHRDLPNWPMWANVMIIVTCAALAATLGYAMKTQDRSRMLTGHWRVQLDSVRYEVALLWPDAGIWDEVSARGHRQWLFKFGNDCALLPWEAATLRPDGSPRGYADDRGVALRSVR